MSAPARHARMGQNATTDQMGSSAAVLKVRASVPNMSWWLLDNIQYVFPGRRADDP